MEQNNAFGEKAKQMREKLFNSEFFKSSGLCEKWLLFLLVDNGLRISEIADARRIVIINDWQCQVWQWKVKKYRLVMHRASMLGLSAETLQAFCKEHVIRRQDYYREFQSLGIEFSLPNGKYASCTHAFRHLKALELWYATKDVNQVRSFLGHASVETTKLYLASVLPIEPVEKKTTIRHDDEVARYIRNKKRNIYGKIN